FHVTGVQTCALPIFRPLFGDGPVHWYTPTNVTLWLALAVLAVWLLFVVGTSGRALIPSRIQSMAELTYGMVHKMIEDVSGKEGRSEERRVGKECRGR